MPENRYFIPRSLQHGDTISLKNEEFHYLKSVMRKRIGDSVEVINGAGTLATATVSKLLDKEAHLTVNEAEQQEKEKIHLNLLLAILKPAHLEYAIEKGCEVGVSSFTLFVAKHSEKKAVSEQYLKRLDTIILSSTRQCGRLYMPTLKVVDKMEKGLEGLILFGDLESSQPIQNVAIDSPVTLVIGPEAGFTKEERELLLAKGAKGVRFCKNTLRAETAAVCGSMLILSQESERTQRTKTT